MLSHTPPVLKEPPFSSSFVPKTLLAGKLEYEEVLGSIRIAVLLGRKAISNKITHFEQAIFASLRRF